MSHVCVNGLLGRPNGGEPRQHCLGLLPWNHYDTVAVANQYVSR